MPADAGAAPPLEDLPTKARKRRRLVTTPAAPPAAPLRPPLPPSMGVGIHPLDPSRLGGSQRIGIIGLPGTGKSTCCRSLLAELCYHYPIITVFSGSEGDNPFAQARVQRRRA